MPLEPASHIDNFIKDAAREYGIDYELLKAHAKRESDFRQDVVREEPQINDASIGVMQVLVKTAQWIMKDTSIDRSRLMQPQYNIRVGARYIKYQLDRYNGDVKKAIAAYNAGSARYKSDGTTFINQPYVDFVFEWYEKYKAGNISSYLGIGIILLAIGSALIYFKQQL